MKDVALGARLVCRDLGVDDGCSGSIRSLSVLRASYRKLLNRFVLSVLLVCFGAFAWDGRVDCVFLAAFQDRSWQRSGGGGGLTAWIGSKSTPV